MKNEHKRREKESHTLGTDREKKDTKSESLLFHPLTRMHTLESET